MGIFKRKIDNFAEVKKYRKLSPDYWIAVAKLAFADGVIDQSVIDRILNQSSRGLIPAIEYSTEKDWDIQNISRPLYDYWSEFIPYELR